MQSLLLQAMARCLTLNAEKLRMMAVGANGSAEPNSKDRSTSIGQYSCDHISSGTAHRGQSAVGFNRFRFGETLLFPPEEERVPAPCDHCYLHEGKPV